MDPNCPASVRKVLFQDMGLEAPSGKRTRTGKASTDAEVCPTGPAAVVAKASCRS